MKITLLKNITINGRIKPKGLEMEVDKEKRDRWVLAGIARDVLVVKNKIKKSINEREK